MNVDLVKRKEYSKEEFYKNRKVIYGGFKGNTILQDLINQSMIA